MEVNGEFNIKDFQNINKNSDFVCMFSGGKDSGLALSIAMRQAKLHALIHIVEDDCSLYHNQNTNVIGTQATLMGVPVYYMNYKWWRNWEEAYDFLSKFKNEGVGYVVFGDIKTKYILKGDIPLCIGAGLMPYVPIGGVSYEDLIKKISEYNIESVMTKINTDKIDSSWLGKVYDKNAYLYFKSIGIDPFGELDEFHTTLVNGSCFSKRIDYSIEKLDDKFAKINLII